MAESQEKAVAFHEMGLDDRILKASKSEPWGGII
jgi:hypothetical protein